MSACWGLRCKTCSADTGCGESGNATTILRDIALMSSELISIQQKDTMGYVELSLMGGSHCFNVSPFAFVSQHIGHELELYNDYGETEPIIEPQWWSVLHSIGTPSGMMQVQRSTEDDRLYCLKTDDGYTQQIAYLNEAQAKAIGAIISELGGIR